MKKAIIIGASSGIGRELARALSTEQYRLGITARRSDELESLRSELGPEACSTPMDVAQSQQAMVQMEMLFQRLGDVDLIIICAGIGHLNPELEWGYEKETIDVNVKGFTCIADIAMRQFIRQGHGHLVALTSVAALRGSGICPAYNASKSYMSNYLEGLRCKARHEKGNITITEIMPGFVDTRMAQGEGLFWVASPQKAANQIWRAICRKKPRAYVTKRWALIALCFRLVPGWIYTRLSQ